MKFFDISQLVRYDARMSPAASPVPPPESIGGHAADNLRFIRQTMERSATFAAVPGAGGAAMGVVALGAAVVGAWQPNAERWLLVWPAAAVVAAAIGVGAMARKATRAGSTLTGTNARRFAVGMAASRLDSACASRGITVGSRQGSARAVQATVRTKVPTRVHAKVPAGVPAKVPAGEIATGLDRLLHDRMRLGIVSVLATSADLSFSDLKAALSATDGNLSVHARKLEDAGYVSCTKAFVGRTPRTDYKLTASGRRALEKYLDHMDAIIRATRRG